MATRDEIVALQRILAATGDYDGGVTGSWTPALRNALAAWQDSNALTATGVYDLATKAAMRDALNFRRGADDPTHGFTKEDLEEARSRYGGLMAYWNHGELGPLVRQAAREGRDSEWLRGQLEQTSYWKRTRESQRAWQQLKVSDPATAQAQLDVMTNIVRDLAGQLGLTGMNAAKIRKIANDSIAFGWVNGQDTSLLQDVLVNTVESSWRPKPRARGAKEPGFHSGGEVQATMDRVKDIARSYGLPSGNNAAWRTSLKLLRGELTEDAVRAQWAQRARHFFPHLGHVIDSGQTIEDWFDPYRQRIAELLERSPEEIDYTQGPWGELLAADENGQAKTIGHAERLARSQKEWWQTSQAREQSASLGLALAREFGAIAR